MSAIILVDTSIWVRHFRQAYAHLQKWLARDSVLMHSLVHAELACGTPPVPRATTLAFLALWRPYKEATTAKTLAFFEKRQLHGRGCGFVNLSLPASMRLAPGAMLWTADRRLADMAFQEGMAYVRSIFRGNRNRGPSAQSGLHRQRFCLGQRGGVSGQNLSMEM